MARCNVKVVLSLDIEADSVAQVEEILDSLGVNVDDNTQLRDWAVSSHEIMEWY